MRVISAASEEARACGVAWHHACVTHTPQALPWWCMQLLHCCMPLQLHPRNILLGTMSSCVTCCALCSPACHRVHVQHPRHALCSSCQAAYVQLQGSHALPITASPDPCNCWGLVVMSTATASLAGRGSQQEPQCCQHGCIRTCRRQWLQLVACFDALSWIGLSSRKVPPFHHR